MSNLNNFRHGNLESRQFRIQSKRTYKGVHYPNWSVHTRVYTNTPRSERKFKRSRLAGHLECFHHNSMCCWGNFSAGKTDARAKARIHFVRINATPATHGIGLCESLSIQSL